MHDSARLLHWPSPTLLPRHQSVSLPQILTPSAVMISDVTLSALANWLGSLTMILIVLYHVSRRNRATRWPTLRSGLTLSPPVLRIQALSVNVKRNQESARRVAAST